MVDWVVQPPSHWLYQMANAFLLLSYLSPNLLALRLLLAGGCLCFALWGLLVLAVSVDTVVWNAFFCLVNLVQAGLLVYSMRPVQLDAPLEAVYAHFFNKEGLRMTRGDFRRLTHRQAYVKALEAGDTFALPGHTATALSLLLSGRMGVYQVGEDGSSALLHELTAMEFIDSPEYVARHTARGAAFNVAIRALDSERPPPAETQLSSASLSATPAASSASFAMPSSSACTVLVLPYTSLARTFAAAPHIRSVVDAVVSRDVTHKLFATGEALRGMTKLTATMRARQEEADAEAEAAETDKQPADDAEEVKAFADDRASPRKVASARGAGRPPLASPLLVKHIA